MSRHLLGGGSVLNGVYTQTDASIQFKPALRNRLLQGRREFIMQQHRLSVVFVLYSLTSTITESKNIASSQAIF